MRLEIPLKIRAEDEKDERRKGRTPRCRSITITPGLFEEETRMPPLAADLPIWYFDCIAYACSLAA
jgi:hypothetical protein